MDVNEGTINAAMNVVATMAIEEIAWHDQIPLSEAATAFLGSRTAAMLFDDTYKLWWDGPAAIADEHLKERSSKR